MAILAFNTKVTGLVGESIEPRRCTMITTDSLATITTAGYLNNQNTNGNPILPTDVFEVLYSFNQATKSGSLGFFQVTYSAATGYSLNIWENPGNVLLPVVSGDFATFNGTAGQIKDSGFLPSDATKTRVVMANAATTANSLAVFADTLGTIKNQSIAATLAFGLTISTGNLSAPNLLYGATPVAQVDPASCTITAAAGAANTSTVTIQLKDGSGTNIARSIMFRVYASSASNGLTLASAASTGFSVASGGLSLANGTAITTQITAMSSATGGCVLSLLDTAKQTSYLVLVLPNGNKISAQLSAGSYG